ncbi:MAG: CDP-glucose 4,6-dehydratase [Planctomycetota bacterium]
MAEIRDFYRQRVVLITGHSGFKGSWLTLLLQELGAVVHGYSLGSQTSPSLFQIARVADACVSHEGDIRDTARVQQVVESVRPEVVFHLAAQPIVRRSYADPLETLGINVMGTASLLEAVRTLPGNCGVVVVTSDKCYENQDWSFGYRETDSLGGHDPYSMSKACAELVVSSWRRSYLDNTNRIRLATARARNVIGGGDWGQDRIVPDCVQSLTRQQPIGVRNPQATRPWQHVLDPLWGYLQLAAALGGDRGRSFAGAWNFGPSASGIQPVRELVRRIIDAWGGGSWSDLSDPSAPHEARALALCCDKAHRELDWWPQWGFSQTVFNTIDWYRHWHAGTTDMGDLTRHQIRDYMRDQAEARERT